MHLHTSMYSYVHLHTCSPTRTDGEVYAQTDGHLGTKEIQTHSLPPSLTLFPSGKQTHTHTHTLLFMNTRSTDDPTPSHTHTHTKTHTYTKCCHQAVITHSHGRECTKTLRDLATAFNDDCGEGRLNHLATAAHGTKGGLISSPFSAAPECMPPTAGCCWQEGAKGCCSVGGAWPRGRERRQGRGRGRGGGGGGRGRGGLLRGAAEACCAQTDCSPSPGEDPEPQHG